MTNDGDLFADLRRFQVTKPPPKQAPAERKRKRKPRRPTIPAPYGSIPYAYTDKLQDMKASGTAWALLFHLDRLIYGPTRKEPLTITAEICKSCRLAPRRVEYALRQLERAGLIAVMCRRRGRRTIVIPLWRTAPTTP